MLCLSICVIWHMDSPTAISFSWGKGAWPFVLWHKRDVCRIAALCQLLRGTTSHEGQTNEASLALSHHYVNIASSSAWVHHVFLDNSNTKSTGQKCLDFYSWYNICHLSFPCGSAGKESVSNAGDLGLIPGLGRLMEREKATQSNILVWRIPWSGRVRHDWVTFTFTFREEKMKYQSMDCHKQWVGGKMEM